VEQTGGSCPETLWARGEGGRVRYLGNALTVAVGTMHPTHVVLSLLTPVTATRPHLSSLHFSKCVWHLSFLSKPRIHRSTSISTFLPPVQDVFLLTQQSFPCQRALTAPGLSSRLLVCPRVIPGSSINPWPCTMGAASSDRCSRISPTSGFSRNRLLFFLPALAIPMQRSI